MLHITGPRHHRAATLLLVAALPVTAAPAVFGGSLTGSALDDAVLLTPETLAQGIVLRDGWRLCTDDDPAWADPATDDSKCRIASSTFDDLGRDWSGVGWLRRRLRVDPLVTEQIIGLKVRQTGASEIYLDGRDVARFGAVNSDPGREVAWDARLPVALAVEPGRQHLLALRFSLSQGHELDSGFRGVVVRLGELEPMTRAASHTPRVLVPFMAGAAGLAGALALVHGLLFLFDRRAREHALFATFSGFLALDVLADLMMKQNADFSVTLLWFRVGVVFLAAMLLAGIQLEMVLFEQRRGWIFRALTVAGAAIVIWAWAIPSLRSMLPLVVFMMLAVAEMLRLAILELIRRRPDSGIVAAGMVVLALSFMGYFGMYFGLFRLPTGLSVLVGWGGAAISLSLFIARRASRTNRDLRHRLDEVAELTRRTLEQERQAARELAERRVLEADNTRKTRELEEARSLQLAMLPGARPHLDRVDVAFRMHTATEVGGDYYDYLCDGPDRCTIAVGDATGHGMHAGMVVAVAKSLFTTLAPTTEPANLLREVSRRLAALGRRNATMAMALVRVDGDRMRIAGAAMPPLLVWRRASGMVEEVALSALPLGVRLGGAFPEAEIDLAPGDTALLTTDGLAEVVDPEGEPWGYDCVAEAFGRDADAEVDDVIDRLLAAARAFSAGGDLPDDVTMVVIRARGSRPLDEL